jgi:hypothetical protein
MDDPWDRGLIDGDSSLFGKETRDRPPEVVTIPCPKCGEMLTIPITFEGRDITYVISNKQEIKEHILWCVLRGKLV